MQQELQMEAKLIQQLTRDESQWTLREDLKNEDDLWDNFFKILQNNNRSKLNDIPLTEKRKRQVLRQKLITLPFQGSTRFYWSKWAISCRISTR